MPEFAGNAVLYFDPYNPKELAVLLASTLEDEKTRSSYGEMAAKRSEVFDIEDSTERTWTLLRTLADQNP
jgi:glycosyltransferase involved in cell wall biosynthesis